MKTVKVYIETTITGPSKPKYGKYAAALAFTRKNGKTEDRFLQGSEQETTYNRSVLLAMVRAMQRFNESCHIIFYTRNTFIRNMIRADNPEKWRCAEQLFLEESKEHEIEIVYEDNSEYKRTLEAYLQGEEA